jgi:hypothetical protein
MISEDVNRNVLEEDSDSANRDRKDFHTDMLRFIKCKYIELKYTVQSSTSRFLNFSDLTIKEKILVGECVIAIEEDDFIKFYKCIITRNVEVAQQIDYK